MVGDVAPDDPDDDDAGKAFVMIALARCRPRQHGVDDVEHGRRVRRDQIFVELDQMRDRRRIARISEQVGNASNLLPSRR